MRLLSGLCGALILALPAGGRVLEEVGTFGIAGFQHAGSLSEIVCLSDGKHVLSSSRDRCVRLWEIETGKLVRIFTKEGSGDMWGIRMLPGETEFLAAGGSGEIIRYNLATGEVVKTYQHSDTAYRIAIHPDGKRFVGTDGKNTAILWDLETGEKIHTYSEHTGDVYTVIIVEGGKTLITGSSDESFKKWDLETGKMIETHQGEKKSKFGDIFTLSASPDGSKFAMVSDDNRVRVYDSKTIAEIWKVKLPDVGQVVDWSPDGKLLATASDDKNIYIFNSGDGKIERKIPVARYGHTPITFTTNGTKIISGGDKLLHVHDVKTGERIVPTLGLPVNLDGFEYAVVGNGGKLIMTGGGEELHVWNTDEPDQSRKFNEPRDISVMVLSHDGQFLALGGEGGDITVRNTTDFGIVKSLSTGKRVNGLVFTPDGTGLVSAGDDNRATHWHLDSGKKVRVFTGSTGNLSDLAMSEDGEVIVTAGDDQTVRIWSMASGGEEAFFNLGENDPYGVAYLNGGRSLIVSISESQVFGRLLPMLREDVVIDSVKIRNLASQLANHDYNVRQAAMMELASMGPGVLPVLDELEVADPEVNSRLDGVKNIIRGSASGEGLEEIHTFDATFGNLKGGPQGRFWAATVGWGGASKLTIGDVTDEKFRVLDTLESDHGPGEMSFSPDGKNLATVNSDGTFSVFTVNRD
ncbi:MAG: WD40 repeat domain-containing protein [Akkermansiaceae bacterium]